VRGVLGCFLRASSRLHFRAPLGTLRVERPSKRPTTRSRYFASANRKPTKTPAPSSRGRYELLKVIACGGTATVYRARDRTTKSLVAVKVLYRGALAAVGDFFNQEARLAARIRSPHLVHASHFGEDDGRPFIVFDLVSGDVLSELYIGGLMPWHELCLVVLDVLAGLSELHRRGITHRDVKPDTCSCSDCSASSCTPAGAGPRSRP
jgi:serine/threonine protein kinase